MNPDDELLPIEEELLVKVLIAMRKGESYHPGSSLYEQERLPLLAEKGWVELAQHGGYVLTRKGTERVERKMNRKTK